MSKEIKLNDFTRILVGEVPAEFYIELLIRLTITFIVALVAMRLIGKRMAAQLSRNELAALVSIAAAIGVVIQAPDRGLLPAILIAFLIVLIGRWIATRAAKNKKFEKISQGNIAVLVKDSVLQLQTMESVRISKERVFAQLRSDEVKTLGEVKRLYIEANGRFSLIKEEPIKPGLSIVPDWDEDMVKEQETIRDKLVCVTCGFTKKQSFTEKQCPYCHSLRWTHARK
jgi:uncharacterized membrane protein YcaP (DUF421 family)